uniref:CX domain-containing protein n=1 Tax=Meloidogyne hapla TaxID=6305 RepID=A0A1I8BD65_MELHA
MPMPVLVICPKNPDSLKYNLILRDISRRLPHMDRVTIGRLISFAIAGAGFSNVGQFMRRRIIQNISDQQTQRLYSLFRRWRGYRNLSEFYDTLFDKYGYTCQDLFQKCLYGYEEIPCCDIFRPHYVMLRGRCMRLRHIMHQSDPADIGRIDVYLNQLPSRLTEKSGMQPQIVAYLTDEHQAVGTFPRYYVHFHSAVLLRARNRQISMLPDNDQCYRRSSCWLRRWLYEKVIEPYNCTVFYLGRNRYNYLPICEPITIVRNYLDVTNLRLDNDTQKRCKPACNRSEHLFQEFRPKGSVMKRNYMPAFRVEVSFTNLEIEVYQEVLTTTLPGFVSQLGGQSGLFVGLSVCSIIQIGISIAWKLNLWYKRFFNGKNGKLLVDNFVENKY